MDGLAALVLAGLQCSPQSLALLGETRQRAPDFFTLLLPVLADPGVRLVIRECLPTSSQLPPCDVSRTLLLLCGCAHLQVSGSELSRRWPACVGPAAAALPYWTVERVMGARLISWWALWRLGEQVGPGNGGLRTNRHEPGG
ncbi:hypothetical protein [Deinococcus marmoris]|uniref:hypothetical protein n=1 Tax=Deinococcus marmoris TaxID=249408 RepID=UPI00096A63A5|nr:hypothetical protein [Deinococcus marmoris]